MTQKPGFWTKAQEIQRSTRSLGLDLWVGVKRLGSQGEHSWNPGLLFIFSATCGSLDIPCLPLTVRSNEGVNVEDPVQLPHTGRPQDVAGPPAGVWDQGLLAWL